MVKRNGNINFDNITKELLLVISKFVNYYIDNKY